jgi:YlmC/YmxH family sporulation protein
MAFLFLSHFIIICSYNIIILIIIIENLLHPVGLLAKEGSRMIKTSDLRLREIINISDGKKLGLIKDLELNLEEGKIEAIVVPGPGKFLGLFGKDNDYVIPWENIKKIGVDVILVDLNGIQTK